MIDGTLARRQTDVGFWRRHPVVVDVLIALSWVIMSSPTFLIGISEEQSEARPALTIVLIAFVPAVLIVAVILVLFRRHRPLLAYAVSMAVTLPLAAYDPGLSAMAAAYCVYAIAVYDSVRRAWVCAAISAVITLIVAGLTTAFGSLVLEIDAQYRFGTAVFFAVTGILIIMVGLFWGLGVRARRRYIDELIAHARVLEHDRDQQAQLAALAERSRIARDIHDIVSHSLSVIVRLADGAEAVFDRDPARARGAVTDVATVARSSLDEMRRVMGVLEVTPGTEPVPSGSGLDDLPHLIDVFRGVGLTVDLSVIADASTAPGVQMTVFRVVQEALTNALRHATSPAVVSVDVELRRDVKVVVTNDGAPTVAPDDARPGRGLVGMRERAALYGGTLTAQPDGHGRWVVRMVLPGVGG